MENTGLRRKNFIVAVALPTLGTQNSQKNKHEREEANVRRLWLPVRRRWFADTFLRPVCGKLNTMTLKVRFNRLSVAGIDGDEEEVEEEGEDEEAMFIKV